MNSQEHHRAHYQRRRDDFSHGYQPIIGQGFGDTYRGCASATPYSISAVCLQPLQARCHEVISVFEACCMCINYPESVLFCFFLHPLDGFNDDTKESHCWKIKAAIKAWSGCCCFFPWLCFCTSLMWSTSFQKQLVRHVIHTRYIVANQMRMGMNCWCLKKINSKSIA